MDCLFINLTAPLLKPPSGLSSPVVILGHQLLASIVESLIQAPKLKFSCVKELMQVKSVEVENPPIGVVSKCGEGLASLQTFICAVRFPLKGYRGFNVNLKSRYTSAQNGEIVENWVPDPRLCCLQPSSRTL
ncbi:hypothetical protein TNCV_5003691 [Trichonephila clavipes]|nr:hypothetical protein TNCV_5003691 [Trichonephila clavipes]